MRNVLTMVVVGLMSVLLTACGQETPKQPELKTESVAAPAATPAAATAEPTAEKPAEAVKQP